MADKQNAPLYKKEIKLAPAIGDWTVYRPSRPSSKKVKPLFYSRHRINRSDLELALNVHHFFANEFAKYLKGSLKASTEVFSISLEQTAYLDFLKSVTQGLIYNKFSIDDSGEVMLLMDYNLANIAINFSLGFQSVESERKDFTEIEESILKSVFSGMMAQYTAAWKNIFKNPELEIISYPNIQRETHIDLNEVLTVITTKVSIANAMPTSFTFVYQGGTLKKLADLYSAKSAKSALNFAALPDQLVNSIEVPVVALLGSTNISANQIGGIEKGDIVSLDQRVNDPTQLFLGFGAEFKTQPGIKDGRIAARILSASVRKVKAAQYIKEEALPSAQPMETPSASAAPSEDLEFPMEEDNKEEYNDAESLLDEEDSNRSGGG